MKKITYLILIITSTVFAETIVKDSIFLSGEKVNSKKHTITIKGKIKYINIEKPLIGTLINLYDKKGIVDSKYIYNDNFTFEVLFNKKYRIEALNKYLIFENKKLCIKTKDNDNIIVIKAKKNPRFNTVVCWSSQGLYPIYFNKKDTLLDCKSKIDLIKMRNYLLNSPDKILYINTHTDSRGNKDDNLKLTKKRAVIIKDFLVKQGVFDKSRIITKWFGDTKISNKCSKNIKCTEKEHQENNRVKFMFY